MSGCETISIRPVPALFRSICDCLRRGSNIDFAVSLTLHCQVCHQLLWAWTPYLLQLDLIDSDA